MPSEARFLNPDLCPDYYDYYETSCIHKRPLEYFMGTPSPGPDNIYGQLYMAIVTLCEHAELEALGEASTGRSIRKEDDNNSPEQ